MPQIIKGHWRQAEDLKVLVGYKVFGRNWTKIQNIEGILRTGVQIRERVDTVLVSDFKRGMWTDKEDPELWRQYTEALQRHDGTESHKLWVELGSLM